LISRFGCVYISLGALVMRNFSSMAQSIEFTIFGSTASATYSRFTNSMRQAFRCNGSGNLLSMKYVGLFVCILAVGGCAQTQVRERTTNYSYTFSDMEDRVVLENIARFIDDRDRLPSMTDFKQGQVQATDNVSLGATLPFTNGLSGVNIVKNPSVFNVGAVQTQSQDNWTYVPVTDVEDLVRTRCLYKYVIVQVEQPERYRSKADWISFQKQNCSLGGHMPVFGYTPPSEPWLIWRPSDQAGSLSERFLDSYGRQYVFLGTFGSYGLWGVPKSFHDFQLALLGSVPNTAGSSAAGTSPAPAKPVADSGQFLLKAALTTGSMNFDSAEKTLTIKFTIINTTQKLLSAVKLTSTRFKLLDETCIPASLANIPANCTATTITTTEDIAKGFIEDLTTAYANDGASLLSSAVDTQISKQGTPKITSQQQPAVLTIAPGALRNFGGIYPQFSPGKASGPVAPPLAPPAQ
jgi:hypothetical protein